METEPDRKAASSLRHPSPPLAVLATVFVGLFVASLVVSTLVAGGAHFPSPFQPGGEEYFARHQDAVALGALLQFGAAIPLGLFTATVVSRLRFLGLQVAGVHIALFGGFAASFFMALSALFQWVLAQPGILGAPGVVRLLHLAAFATGGPGHVVPLGLLVAGVAVTTGLSRLLPRWVMVFGLVVAVVAELSTLSLIWHPLMVLLPLARFPALVFIIIVGVLMPVSRAARRDPRDAPTTSGARVAAT
jgi:hypothetical protein